MTDPSPRTAGGLPTPLWAGPAVIQAVGVLKMPYGYYGVVRLTSTVAALVIVWMGIQRIDRRWMIWPMALLAILFNPLFPIRLQRGIWGVIDLAAAATFVVVGIKSRRTT